MEQVRYIRAPPQVIEFLNKHRNELLNSLNTEKNHSEQRIQKHQEKNKANIPQKEVPSVLRDTFGLKELQFTGEMTDYDIPHIFTLFFHNKKEHSTYYSIQAMNIDINGAVEITKPRKKLYTPKLIESIRAIGASIGIEVKTITSDDHVLQYPAS